MELLDYAPKAKHTRLRKWLRPRNVIFLCIALTFLIPAWRIGTEQLHLYRARRAAKAAAWNSYDQMHAFYVDQFVHSQGFGNRRLINEARWPRSRMIELDGGLCAIGNVELISLNDGKPPFVYRAWRDDIVQSSLKQSDHIPADQYQLAALEELKQGKNVVLTGRRRSKNDWGFAGYQIVPGVPWRR